MLTTGMGTYSIERLATAFSSGEQDMMSKKHRCQDDKILDHCQKEERMKGKSKRREGLLYSNHGISLMPVLIPSFECNSNHGPIGLELRYKNYNYTPRGVYHSYRAIGMISVHAFDIFNLRF
jgi:hypothetical protein